MNNRGTYSTTSTNRRLTIIRCCIAEAIKHGLMNKDKVLNPDPEQSANYGWKNLKVAKVKDKHALQGDMIENPTYITEHKLQLNYAHYITNQIMKPIQQLLAMVIEQVPEFKQSKHRREMMTTQFNTWKKTIDSTKFEKKCEDYRNREIKRLLFDKYIQKTLIERKGISSYFIKMV